MKKFWILTLIIFVYSAVIILSIMYLRSFKISSDLKTHDTSVEELLYQYHQFDISKGDVYKPHRINGLSEFNSSTYIEIPFDTINISDSSFITPEDSIGTYNDSPIFFNSYGRLHHIDETKMMHIIDYAQIKIYAELSVSDALHISNLDLITSYSYGVPFNIRLSQLDYNPLNSGKINAVFSIDLDTIPDNLYFYSGTEILIELYREDVENTFRVTTNIQLFHQINQEQTINALFYDDNSGFKYILVTVLLIGEDYIALSSNENIEGLILCIPK